MSDALVRSCVRMRSCALVLVCARAHSCWKLPLCDRARARTCVRCVCVASTSQRVKQIRRAHAGSTHCAKRVSTVLPRRCACVQKRTRQRKVPSRANE
eukprot:1710532-Pleurochrysis_carterae.AAC.1